MSARDAEACEARPHPFPKPSCVPTASGPAYTTHVGLAVAMVEARRRELAEVGRG